MARSDLILKLLSASNNGDKTLYRRTLEAMIAEERQKQHHVLADRLSEYLKPNGSSDIKSPSNVDDRIQQILFELTPQRSLNELILPEHVVSACQELVEEHSRRDLLRSYNLEPRHRILLAGPPGNGKTTLAEAIAHELAITLFVVRYEGIIGSYLGETAVRLRRLFDFVRTQHCVLFFDEFDTLGKERGDVHETGEIKRVVSSLLLQIDNLPSHVLVVTATNHPELLDRAVWRRFQLRVLLPSPTNAQLLEWVQRFEISMKEPLGVSSDVLASKLAGLSFAEVEEFGTDVLRRKVLATPNGNLQKIIKTRLEQLKNRYQVNHKRKTQHE